jgi:2-oxoglutarate ferredoxin oxidoreductase subunit delta
MKNFRPKTTKLKKGEWTVFAGLCKGCGLCLAKCPQQALIFGKDKGFQDKPLPQVLPEKCRLCQTCEMTCPELAIRVDKK